MARLAVSILLTARRESPAVHTAAPNNTKSFKRNWPGIGEIKGNVYPIWMIPGVEIKKVSVRINMMIAPRLPQKEIFGLTDFMQIYSSRHVRDSLPTADGNLGFDKNKKKIGILKFTTNHYHMKKWEEDFSRKRPFL